MNHICINRNNITGTRQRGVALIVGLILLLVMTIIAVAATHGTVLEQKMTGNQRNKDLAFEAAEAGLRDGESYLSLNLPPAFNNTNGFYTYDPTVKLWETVNWSSSSSDSIAFSGTLPGLASQPRYYVEQLPPSPAPGQDLSQPQYGNTPPLQYFRITARGVGGEGTAQVILQTTQRP